MAKNKGSAKVDPRPGRLRIVAGKWRSRLLPVADAPGLRPTAERVRETLFNWLANRIAGSHCLDLYAGTGALAFEALSRGASAVTLVEKSSRVARGLQQSKELLDAHTATIECEDALRYLQVQPDKPYDIVFLDPPFAADLLEESCRLLQSNGWLDRQALVYLEQDKRQSPFELPVGWRIEKEKLAGNVRYQLINVAA